MKKKLIASILCLAMVLAIVTPAVFANEEEGVKPSTEENVTPVVENTEAPTETKEPEGGATTDEGVAPIADGTEAPAESEGEPKEGGETAPASEEPAEAPAEGEGEPKETETPAEESEAPVEGDPTPAPETPVEGGGTTADDSTAGDAAHTEAPVDEPTEAPVGDPETDPEQDKETPEEGETEEEDTEVFDVAMAYSYILSLETDIEIEAYLATLTEEQLSALESYLYEKVASEYPEPKTVSFTQAAPFLEAVEVARAKLRITRSEDEEGNGIIQSKTATKHDGEDGDFDITIEVYTTGSVTTTTKTTPVDIVLVLDQSGSMAYNFSGDQTNTNSERRQYAMKNSVKTFIDAVADKYSSDADHRIAIVTYSSSTTVLQSWTAVNESGKTGLSNAVNNLPDQPSGATRVDLGVQKAVELMGNNYSYSGKNTTRQKVVIVFTDGVPTTQSDFDTSVATSAINAAKGLKDSGCTVYSIGIFNGANVAQLHGEKWDYAAYEDISCTGEVGTFWGGSYIAGLAGSNDFAQVDIPAGNRFLNYLSSNFAVADQIGVEKGTYNPGDHGFFANGTGYKITNNFQRTGTGYYLTASDSDSLLTIFKTISQNIASPTISLGSDAVITDTVADSFEIPQGATVKVTKVACTGVDEGGEYTWANEGEDISNLATVNGRTVSVTGYDFDANYVTSSPKTIGENDYGFKVVITFTINVREGFLGGNGVYTNVGDSSGVYKDNEKLTCFDEPTVNVPIGNVTVTASEKNVYLTQVPTEEQLKNGVTVKCGGVDITDPNTLQNWQKAYVDVTVTGPTQSDGFNATADGSYTVTATVSPKTEGDSTKPGTVATEKTGNATKNINVFKPELTFKDGEAYYGDNEPSYEDNLTKTEWKHGNTVSTDTGVNMIGTAPTLSLTYTPETGAVEKSTVETNKDYAVGVTVKIGENDVTTHTNFNHTKCEGDDSCKDPVTNDKFWIHVKTCDLTIQKTVQSPFDADDAFVFTVNGENVQNLKVVVKGNGSVTIKGLKVGDYTVIEDAGSNQWSWRYTQQSCDPTDGKVTLSAAMDNGTITFTNTVNNKNWLGDSAYAKNEWKNGNVTRTDGTATAETK